MDHTLKVWDARGGTLNALRTYGGSSEVRTLAYSPDGSELCSGSRDKTLKVWDARGGTLDALRSYKGNPRDVGKAWDNTTFGANPALRAGNAGNSVAQSFQQPDLLASIQTHNSISTAAYHPSAPLLSTGHEDGTVLQWRISPDQHLSLFWCSKAQPLTAQDLKLEGALSLLPRYTELLKQRGAIGEPDLKSSLLPAALGLLEDNLKDAAALDRVVRGPLLDLLAIQKVQGPARVTRTTIYQAFLKSRTPDTSLAEAAYRLSEVLAFELFKAKTSAFSESMPALWSLWEEPAHQSVRASLPLRAQAEGFGFICSSFQAYFMAQHLYHVLLEGQALSAYVPVWNAVPIVQLPEVKAFWVEAYQGSDAREVLELRLRELIDCSKKDPSFATAASNAISLLAAAKLSFSGLDFSGIQIPGADLSGALCEGTNFEGANLEGVNFEGAYLKNSSLRAANLRGVFKNLSAAPLIRQHSSKVTACCYAPDGQSFAVAEESGLITLYDSKTLQKRWVYEGHTECVWALAWHPHRPELASGSLDYTLKVWDTTGTLLEPLRTYKDTEGYAIAYSPSGLELASGAQDGVLKVWDATGVSLEPLRIYKGHTQTISALAYHPSGTELASGSADGELKVWNATGAILDCLRSSKAHEDCVNALAYRPDGLELASGDSTSDATIKVWNAQGAILDCLRSYQEHRDGIYALAYHPSGLELASCSVDQTLKVWDAQGAKLQALRTYEGHTDQVCAIAYESSGKKLLSVSIDSTLRLWDANQAPLKNLSAMATAAEAQNPVSALTYHPSGSELAVGYSDGAIRVWVSNKSTQLRLLRTHEEHMSEEYVGGVSALAYHPSGLTLASGSCDRTIRIWETSGKTSAIRIHEGHQHTVTSVAYHPSGEVLASGSRDGTLKVWSARGDTKVLRTYKGHQAEVQALAYHPSGTELASGSADETLKVWDASGSKLESLRTYEGHQGAVNAVIYSASGLEIVSASTDCTLKAWDASGLRAEALRTYEGDKDDVYALSYDTSGHIILSASSQALKIWDARGIHLEALKTVLSNSTLSPLVNFACSPQGERLATGHADGMVLEWFLGPDCSLRLESSSKPLVSMVVEGMDIQGAYNVEALELERLEQEGAVVLLEPCLNTKLGPSTLSQNLIAAALAPPEVPVPDKGCLTLNIEPASLESSSAQNVHTPEKLSVEEGILARIRHFEALAESTSGSAEVVAVSRDDVAQPTDLGSLTAYSRAMAANRSRARSHAFSDQVATERKAAPK